MLRSLINLPVFQRCLNSRDRIDGSRCSFCNVRNFAVVLELSFAGIFEIDGHAIHRQAGQKSNQISSCCLRLMKFLLKEDFEVAQIINKPACVYAGLNLLM